MIYICPRCGVPNEDNWPMPLQWKDTTVIRVKRPNMIWGHCQSCWEQQQDTNYRRQLLAVIQASGMTRQEIDEILDEAEAYIKANRVTQ